MNDITPNAPISANSPEENETITSEKMTVAEFEQRLPEFFSTGTGRVSDDPRFQAFLQAHPESAALVRDLEYIAEQARALFEPDNDAEPSEAVWSNIQSKLKADPAELPELPGEATS